MVDGISFVFQDYRNLSKYVDFKDYVNNYKNKIEQNYGFKPKENEGDIDYFFGEILDNKDLDMYEYIVAYTASNKIFKTSSYNRAWHYFYMNQHAKSIEYWKKTIANIKEITPRVFYYNFKKAIDSYLILNNPNGAIDFLEKSKNILPQYKLTFNYFIAKVSLENNVKRRVGKKYLKYCQQNYVENKYFKIEDLDTLK